MVGSWEIIFLSVSFLVKNNDKHGKEKQLPITSLDYK